MRAHNYVENHWSVAFWSIVICIVLAVIVILIG